MEKRVGNMLKLPSLLSISLRGLLSLPLLPVLRRRRRRRREIGRRRGLRKRGHRWSHRRYGRRRHRVRKSPDNDNQFSRVYKSLVARKMCPNVPTQRFILWGRLGTFF